MRSAMNEVLRDAYVEDCEKCLERWNKRLAGTGVELTLPSRRFHRRQGMFAGASFDPAGRLLRGDADTAAFLPSESDRVYVRSLMDRPVTAPGAFASWIAPPARGIDGRPIDFQYVRTNEA
jgi:benzoyl-CoA 2,3-dioxygenase component B